jgi:hypothetical protein
MTQFSARARRLPGRFPARPYENYVVKFPPPRRDPRRALLTECPLFQVFMRNRWENQAGIDAGIVTSKKKVNHWLFSQTGCESTRQRVTSRHWHSRLANGVIVFKRRKPAEPIAPPSRGHVIAAGPENPVPRPETRAMPSTPATAPTTTTITAREPDPTIVIPAKPETPPPLA